MRKQAVIAALALMSLMQAGTASATITETRSDNWVYDPGVPNGRFDPYVWPYWRLDRAEGQETLQGTIEVTSDGGPFRFESMVLYSSISSIPYVFTGKLGSAVVFTATGTFPAPEGNFLTQSNPYSSAWIDRLEITLSNPALPECQAGCGNPIGYRSISVSTSAVTSGVPEPEALALSAIGLLTVMTRRKKVRPRICS